MYSSTTEPLKKINCDYLVFKTLLDFSDVDGKSLQNKILHNYVCISKILLSRSDFQTKVNCPRKLAIRGDKLGDKSKTLMSSHHFND